MNNLILILLLIISNGVFSQEPPAYFKFNYKGISKDSIDLSDNFEIRTYVYRENINPNSHKSLKPLTFKFSKEDKILVPISDYRPGRKDITLISIKRKNTNDFLNIYIRFCNLLDFGEIVSLDNLEFTNGNFFYDMCKSRPKFEIECQESYNSKVDLTKIKAHRISIKRLNRIMNMKICE
ncbi:hypothetical protein MG296_14435 [Flavobacteriaceae bacterium TK19130]|nr:hypothetical protein [Thermobacterium salinum]